MLRKTSVNGDESTGNEGQSWNTKGRLRFINKKRRIYDILEQFNENGYPAFDSENEDEVKEICFEIEKESFFILVVRNR
jgi:hypothetical protein